MTGDTSWQRIKELFQVAIEREPDDRSAFLEQACGGDRALQRQVESLLAAHREAGAFAERPALEMLAESPPANVEYQILSLLGAGGMGEVFRARDVALGREVAIKILPPRFAENPERLLRFEREARVLASLNHPNICGIYGLTEINGAPALVLELVDGQTLAERLHQRHSSARRLALKEALTIARDIGRALEAAHEKGIIHRDLKPANIKITPDGVLKVLDFGLAKANVENPRPGDDAGNAMPACDSQDGALLGTAAYMSPEQARGEPADKRTDIWSFGCVLYEMIAGRRAVQGSTVSETLAAIAESEPDWTDIRRSAPPNIERLLRRCLDKDAKRRLRDIGDAGIELDEAITSSDGSNTVVAGRPVAPTSGRAWGWSLAAAVVVLGASLALLWPRGAARAPATELRRVSMESGSDALFVPLLFGQGSRIILSPDGGILAFLAQAREGAARQIYLRRLNELHAAPLKGTDGALNPFFSPDGQWIAFFADGKLKKVPTAGGGAVTISAVPPNNRGGAWGENGIIAFSPDREHAPLWQVSSSGGEPVPLTTLGENEITQRWPQILPGGEAVLFTGNDRADGFQEANVVVQSLPAGPRKVLVRGAFHGRYLASGHLVYVHDATLFAAPFDLDRLEMTGPAVPVLEGAAMNTPVGAAEIAFSDTGTVAYLPAPETVNYDNIEAPIEWMDRRGTTRPLRTMSTRWFYPRFASNGRQLAFSLFDGIQYDVWIYDWSRDDLTRLTFDPAGDFVPVWTPDSRRIVFTSGRHNGRTGNLYWQRVDNTGEAQRLTTADRQHNPGSWHPNGRLLAFTEVDPQTGASSIMMLRLDGDEASGWRPADPVRFLKDAESPMFSPDGRWLAYTSKSSANVGTEVFVSPFPGPGGPWQVSTDGGANPVWSLTRPELFYGAPDDHIMATSYSAAGGSFRVEKPRAFGRRFVQRPVGRSFDVHPDGDRFALATVPDTEARHNHVTLVFGFFDELRRIAR